LLGGQDTCRAAGLKADEQMILYPALARAVAGGWEVQFHGIVYEPEKRLLLAKVMRRALGIDDEKLTAAEKVTFKQRSAYFLVDNEHGKELPLTLAGRTWPLGSSAANGHFESLAVLMSSNLPALPTGATDTNLTLPASIALRGGGQRALNVQLTLLHEHGLSVISDIDDTIKISDVRNKKALAMNTFCRPFQPVPGMAETYQSWAKEGAQFHYLSASPWQLYLPLSEFTRSNGFPVGTFHMKTFRVKDGTFTSLLASPEKYKPPVIEELFQQFPERRYVLVGDSGEKDPEIYGAIARKHPQRVRMIFIRDVTDEAADSARYRKAFRDMPADRWRVFKKASELSPSLPKQD
jgi:hypothetical protein